MIGVLEYGVGNVGSINSMLRHIGYESVPVRNKYDLDSVKKLIIPGVGSFDHGITKINSIDVVQSIKERCDSRALDVLGICLGMQMLFSNSDEGHLPGMGLIEGCVRRIVSTRKDVKIPHMGWNTVEITRPSRLFPDPGVAEKFYFVHSYHCVPAVGSIITSFVEHGDVLVASVSMDNIHGVQFHPEKSHKYGMRILDNFVKI